ncbi:Cyclic pyranopterin monophosphate synthase, mitochondrial [Actinomortierella wolfii]|nr:Cyclic pyranopterin monophosphate synthase, mitochondrial [Actinomortierella wolfii]
MGYQFTRGMIWHEQSAGSQAMTYSYSAAAALGTTRLFSTTSSAAHHHNNDINNNSSNRSHGHQNSDANNNNKVSTDDIHTPLSSSNDSGVTSSTPPPPRLTHTDPETGRASMVSVTEKAITARTATARASIWLPAMAFELLKHNKHKKGDVLTVAQIAGIQAAKQTSNLIPLCHPLLLSHIAVDLTLKEEEGEERETKKNKDECNSDEGNDRFEGGGWVLIESRVACKGNTGVEMEALTAASVAALTVFDMCKAVGKDMVIGDIYVEEKTGGKSGHYRHGQRGADRRGHGI